MGIEIEESQFRQRSATGIEECLSQQRSTKMEWVGSLERIIEAPVGIEELPSCAVKCREGGV